MPLDFAAITKKWQGVWEKKKLGYAEPAKGKKKFYLIFAYPGVSGFLHVGHMRGYAYADVIARFKRMQGYNVLFPAGFHASGLPAIAYAAKIRKKDPETIEQLKAYGLNKKQISALEKPENTVEFYKNVYVEDFWKKFGFLIDFRRLISTIQPEYNKFMEWQFAKLKENGLLVQKPHFSSFCPNCGPVAIDTAETDISQGGNAETLDYIVIKFKIGNRILPAATLRAETVFGVTNIWINPKSELVVVKYNNEEWLFCKESAEKIVFQKNGFEITSERIPAKDLIGKKVINQFNNENVLILPADFVDCGVGTGVVMSVPSHAPYDWIALKVLQEYPEKVEHWNISPDELLKLKPVSLIATPGFGEHPAVEISNNLGIKDLSEIEKLEQATKIVYEKEFHQGRLNSLYGQYVGRSVSEAKEFLVKEFAEKGMVDELYGFSEKVVCRCGREVVVKLIPDQWFIKYSDLELKEKTKKHSETMLILPEQYKKEFPGVIDWFNDRACVRQGSWLGTRFPFDNRWIIEPISDSTLYPLTYIFSKYVNNGKIKEKNLCNEFFDYVFLDKGNLVDVTKITGLDKKTIEKVRQDFLYWYPLDLNLGGKEHKTVHFPVFVMNHVGVMREQHWPKGMFVNWWVVGEKGKISKSKGGAASLHDLATKFSIDALRLYYCNISSAHADIVFKEETAQQYKNTLQKCYSIFEAVSKIKKENKRKVIDNWLIEKTVQSLKKAEESMNALDLKDFSQTVYYSIPEDFSWYFKRGGLNKKITISLLEKWAKLLVPVTPHLAEEIWHRILRKKNLVSLEEWKSIDKQPEEANIKAELLVKTVLDDIENIKGLTKIQKPKRIVFFVAPSWKWNAIKVVAESCKEKPDFKLAMQNWLNNTELKEHVVDAQKIIKKILANPPKQEDLIPIPELDILNSEKNFLEEKLKAKIEITEAQNAKPEYAEKAKSAMPMKPAIFLE